MDSSVNSIDLWRKSANAWIEGQGESGDQSRKIILDPALNGLWADLYPTGFTGLKVADVGCGEGRYSRFLSSLGADVVGIDPVEAFIDRAHALHPQGRYHVGFGHSLPLESGSIDLALCYLSLLDMDDDAPAIAEIGRVLKEGGRCVVVAISNMCSSTEGWVKDSEGNRLYRPVDDYMTPKAMRLSWKGIEIINFHRPLSQTLASFFENGFVLDRFLEPLPPKDHPWFAEEVRVPNFQIYALKKERPSL